MLRILFTHFSVQEYTVIKSALHKISNELSVSHIECDDKLFNLLQYFVPDILFVDLSVDDKASIRSLQKLRSEQRFNSLPVVIYSQAADWRYVKEYYFSESNHFMSKPYSFENLCKTLEQTLTPNFSTEQFPFKKMPMNSYVAG
ncbi:MAG: response regulator [Chitinophagaceae bacterium]